MDRKREREIGKRERERERERGGEERKRVIYETSIFE